MFVEALRKVCTEGAHFERIIHRNIVRLAREKKAFINMYLAFRKHREAGPSESEHQRLHRELLAAEPSLFASHPTFRERQEAAGRLPVAASREEVSALGLFEAPEQVERELTDFLTGVIAERKG